VERANKTTPESQIDIMISSWLDVISALTLDAVADLERGLSNIHSCALGNIEMMWCLWRNMFEITTLNVLVEEYNERVVIVSFPFYVFISTCILCHF
jgi:hypothetical protein